jgi:beta-glucosidase
MNSAYRDPDLSVDERVSDLLGRMTLQEKVAQLGAIWFARLVKDDRFDPERASQLLEHGIGQVTRIGASTGLLAHQTAAITNDVQRVLIERTRLGIPMVVHEESTAGFLHRGATTYPHALALGATWDPSVVGEIATSIRREMLAVGARHTLAPVLDVARDPRWGRVEETYGESPELCARLGVAYVRALQTDDLRAGVVCTGKHFLAYGASVGGRNHAPVHLGPRELREVYAEPFAAAIREAGLASVMNSYSSIDGLPCVGSHQILTDLLRDELGFDGVVVADYFAVGMLATHHRTAADRGAAAVQALRAGLDVELPSLDYYLELPAMVDAGRVTEAEIDTAVERVLVQKLRLGLFEQPFVAAPERAGEVFDTPASRALARRAATQGLCLLTNDGVLPLDPARLSRVAVIGPHADDRRLLQGDYHYPAHLEIIFATDGEATAEHLPESGGSFTPGPWYTPHVTPRHGLRAALGSGVEVLHHTGCHHLDPIDQDLAGAAACARSADVAVVCVGARSGLTTASSVGEARDAMGLDLPGAQAALVAAVAATGVPTIVAVISGRVHTLGELTPHANALLWTAPPGEEGGNALADVLLGAADPGGRLPVTIPRHVGQLPLHHDQRARADRSEFWGDYVDGPVTPAFAFGHGLSYATFVLTDAVATAGSTAAPTSLAVTVTNTSGRPGTHVVQLYGRDDIAAVARPNKELLGFARVALAAGESARLDFEVHPSRLAFHDHTMALVCEPGTFTFWLAASAADETVELSVELTGPVTTWDRRRLVPTLVGVGPLHSH